MWVFFVVCAVLGIVVVILDAGDGSSGGTSHAHNAMDDTHEPDATSLDLSDLHTSGTDPGIGIHSSFGESPSRDDHPLGGINPANGMPMLPGDTIDIRGNPFGVDLHDSFHTGIGGGLGGDPGIGHSGCGHHDW